MSARDDTAIPQHSAADKLLTALAVRAPRQDPAVPANGRCYMCDRERKLARLKPVYLHAMMADPFCSTECCRRYYALSDTDATRATVSDDARTEEHDANARGTT